MNRVLNLLLTEMFAPHNFSMGLGKRWTPQESPQIVVPDCWAQKGQDEAPRPSIITTLITLTSKIYNYTFKASHDRNFQNRARDHRFVRYQ